MEELMLIFPFVAQEIFEKLDNKSLTTCRLVEKSWKTFIDERNYPWIRIVELPKIPNRGNTFLHLAAKAGQIEMFEEIFSESDDKNPANDEGLTPFHLACSYGQIKVVGQIQQV